ncbi:nucleotidyltransferase family protein [Pseudonocardia eucalypti]|uniref:Nucleotidyltransferase family protein n=2 Tax=Pseudonocardia eucalypti TaxID=648755 RepID=A0ABP9PET3_9PSEU|nr:nicotine blue oxidoreductase [Pseudonocardia eucalypti]
MGGPKALVELAGRPLVLRALDALREGGCAPLVVVLGAAADRVAPLLPPDALPMIAPDWAEGMGASLRAGLASLRDVSAPAALVHLVDLPGVGAPAIARLAACADEGPDVLARAAYHARPGHPVLLGRAHWPAVAAAARGDAGARDYLSGHPALRLVECGDLADPRDVDTPEALRAFSPHPSSES